MVNGPQLGCRLKYFIRLGPIGFAYCKERFGVSDLGYKIRRWRLRLKICGARFGPIAQALCRGNLRRRSDKRISFLIPL